MIYRPSRRSVMCVAFGTALALATAALAPLAKAQAYPNAPIRLIVPYTPGGATDILSRLLADRITTAQSK